MQLTICCPEGGSYPVEARRARVLVNERGQALVEFPCPRCEREVLCVLDEHSALRLIGLGIKGMPLRPAAEVTEAHEGPPLTLDDLLDLHLLLEHPGWLDRLERGPS